MRKPRRGHVVVRGEKVYGVLDVRAEDGRRRQVWRSGFTDAESAQEWLNEEIRRQRKGIAVAPSRESLGAWLEEWFEGLETDKETTLATYRWALDSHILPALGAVRLQKLTVREVDRFYASLRKARGDRKPLGGASRQVIHIVLRSALSTAVAKHVIEDNPADRATKPKVHRKPASFWEPQHVRRFLGEVEGTRMYPAWRLAAVLGLRRGEVCGLRWPQVDLEGGRIRIVENAVVVRKEIIRHAPKTEGSVATLPIDAETVDALRRWRKQQMAEALEWGEAYERSDVVFTREDGQQVHPEWLSDELKRIARRLELPPLTFRGLRHSAASTALALGVHPRVVQQMLRHQDVRTTLGTYSHVTETLAAEAVTRNAEALRAERPVRESR